LNDFSTLFNLDLATRVQILLLIKLDEGKIYGKMTAAQRIMWIKQLI